uniref:Uncharacterized protein n=1 Tax=Arundo donax TaxID=35708 RepID=A0A0A9EEB4_ARUDO
MCATRNLHSNEVFSRLPKVFFLQL